MMINRRLFLGGSASVAALAALAACGSGSGSSSSSGASATPVKRLFTIEGVVGV